MTVFLDRRASACRRLVVTSGGDERLIEHEVVERVRLGP
jgi:hypothetical protein